MEWSFAPPPDPQAVDRLLRELRLPDPICALLVTRRWTDPEEAKRFLRPRLEHLHPPEALKDLDVAVDRLMVAIQSGETILVHGDYDVDGICAAALLTLWLRRMGGRVVPFVPHRLRDGYDLGEAGIRAAQDAAATLLVTCDSGVSALGAVDEAVRRGIEVIVTDHHTPGATLPNATAVVNPNRADCTYPNPGLCGAGVVFKLCQGLAARAGIAPAELWPHLDLVALATVADLVPLTGENRVLTRFGLRYLAGTGKVGLRALLVASGHRPGDGVDAGQVGFTIAPRINAAGRIGDSAIALELLLADHPERARELAKNLDELNTRRRDADRSTFEEALIALEREFDPERDLGVVLAGEGWHPGVIGIVASRLVERIHRPVVLVAMDGEQGRGSARSIPGVHLYEAFKDAGSHLLRFGGHRQAAGMEVSRTELPAFKKAFNASVTRQLSGRVPPRLIGGELELRPSRADRDLHTLLEHLGPFGIGNPRPVFWARGLRLAGRPRVVGDGHLKLRLTESGVELDAIGFGLANRVDPEILGGGEVDALFKLTENEYRGVRSLQARLVDVRPSEGARVAPGAER
jgi:single-stranded-DNA-specific exonuclease